MNFTKKTRRPKIQMLTPCTSSILDERNAHLFWRHCPLRCQRRAPSLFARAPTHSPNCSQGEVNRQSSTSSAPSFLRLVGDESRTDDKKKAAKCVAAPQLLSLAFFLSVAPLNVSFIQNQSKNLRPPPSPPPLLVAENQIGQPDAEVHVAHTIWVHSLPRTSVQSQIRETIVPR